MARQLSFLDPTPAIPPRDPKIAPRDKARLSGQNGELLVRLRRGPVTNVELQAIGMLKYTSRISDLRKAGYRVTAERVSGGVFVYRLEE